MRYEMIHARHLPVRVAQPGYDFGYGDVFDTPALVLGDPSATALVVVGTKEELLRALDKAREALTGGPRRTEVVVDRDPDHPTDVRIWIDEQDVTDEATTHVAVIDPGAGWTRASWEEHTSHPELSTPAQAFVQDVTARHADSEHIID